MGIRYKNPCVKCITYVICRNRMIGKLNTGLEYIKDIYKLCTFRPDGYSQIDYINEFHSDVYRVLINVINDECLKCSLLEKFHVNISRRAEINTDLTRILSFTETFKFHRKFPEINRYLEYLHINIDAYSNSLNAHQRALNDYQKGLEYTTKVIYSIPPDKAKEILKSLNLDED